MLGKKKREIFKAHFFSTLTRERASGETVTPTKEIIIKTERERVCECVKKTAAASNQNKTAKEKCSSSIACVSVCMCVTSV